MLPRRSSSVCSFTALLRRRNFPHGKSDRHKSMVVGVCQRVARNLPPEAHMIELGLLSTKTSFDIAETFAIGELSKGQTKELIPAGEIFDVAMALVSIDANLKLVGGEEVHELRENGSALVHLLPPEQAGKQ